MTASFHFQIGDTVARYFFIAYLALALLVIFAAPAAFEDIPRPLAAWGKLLQIVVRVGSFSRITRFEAQAWLMLVVMWTFLPVAVWWVARGNWVVSPDRNGMPGVRRWWSCSRFYSWRCWCSWPCSNPRGWKARWREGAGREGGEFTDQVQPHHVSVVQRVGYRVWIPAGDVPRASEDLNMEHSPFFR